MFNMILGRALGVLGGLPFLPGIDYIVLSADTSFGGTALAF